MTELWVKCWIQLTREVKEGKTSWGKNELLSRMAEIPLEIVAKEEKK